MNDFFDELGELALGSRLKRLSDRMYADALNVYKAFNMPIQPKWFSLLALLYSKGRLSVVEAADSLKLSQPALSQFCKQLSTERLIDIHVDESDSRKRILTLSKKGWVTISNLQTLWRGIGEAAKELCENAENDFYQSLLKFEESLDNKSLLTRSQNKIEKLTQNKDLTFLPYNDTLAPYFEVINIEWIESMFTLEEIDRKVLCNPQKYIIAEGGHIWFAQHPLYGIVGTCALMKTAEREYELTKMGVLPTVRGLKIGEALLSFVIQEAIESLQARKLYLLTNKKCQSAIHLYEKLGFVHSEDIMTEYGGHYERCNVAMEFVVK